MKRKSNFLLKSLCGQNILMDMESESLLFTGVTTFNEAGRFLWENMEQETDAETLASLLADKYNIDKETALADTLSFIDSLREDGCIDE